MKRYIITGVLGLMVLSGLNSCKKYLDVVPQGVATLDNAFTLRAQAEKFLFTCYSFMPKDASVENNPALLGGDEMWRWAQNQGLFNIAKGLQNKVSPYGGQWQSLYQGIRDCNIFLENIEPVPDMSVIEKKQWIAEVKFLKAYYYFCLVRQYGPVPLIKTNLPVSVGVDEAQTPRDPVDSCFNYIAQLIDEAVPDLPFAIDDPSRNSGRITQPIALACKAKALVYAASPLFNGNPDMAGLKNPDGTQLFNTEFSKAKWDSAVAACQQAIDFCDRAGFRLYYYRQSGLQQYNLTDTIQTQMSIRNSFTERWNSEIIWANTQSVVTGRSLENDPDGPSSLQNRAMPQIDPSRQGSYMPRSDFSPPMKIAEMFYSDNGVPINEDKTWDYNNRYGLRVAGADDSRYIRNGYTTVNLHFNREPRFYADLGFDGGVWYGQGRYDDANPSNLFYVAAKTGQFNGIGVNSGTITGYFVKKFTHYQNVIGNAGEYSVTNYPWPTMRLSELYLLYAEALNEANGPGSEAYKYIDSVRSRAGLPSVEYSWTNYSINPSAYTTQQGLRNIIHRERLIELAFEGQRFWDLRRWKEAPGVMNALIQGWDGPQKEPEYYYRPVTVFKQTFGQKDYFFPIQDNEVLKNKNLVQNLGW